MESFIADHGYLLLAGGALLEGETIVALAGFAAHRGYLNIGLVVAIAATAGWIGDQVLFHVGRRHGARVVGRFEGIARQVTRVHRLVERHPWTAAVGVRFAYGLRVAGPIVIGGSGLPAARFAVMNAVGALIWASIVAAVGWFFGQAVETMLGRLPHVDRWLFGALAIAGFVYWLFSRWRAARAR